MRFTQEPLPQRGQGSGRPSRRRLGTAVVEMAILAPFLCLILLGMFELGRAVMVKNILSDAARKACRTGIKRDKGNWDAITEVTNIMRDNGFTAAQFDPFDPGAVTITVTDPNGVTLPDSLDAPSGTVVSVQVGIRVAATTWVPPLFLGSNATLQSETVVMMKQ
jgi:Flp pilus assembly protein TadG